MSAERATADRWPRTLGQRSEAVNIGTSSHHFANIRTNPDKTKKNHEFSRITQICSLLARSLGNARCARSLEVRG